MMHRWVGGLFLSVALLSLLSCTPKADEKVVNLAIWGNYLSPDQIKAFTQQTGIKINISNYSSNEELLAKIQAGAASFDVAVPSDYMVEIMAKMGLLHKLDLQKIRHYPLINPTLLKPPYDPDNAFSLPYAWTTTGIAVNRDLYKGTMKSWKDLLDNAELSGKISLLDDVREALGAALKMKGHSLNSTNPKDLQEAKAALGKARHQAKMFTSDTIDILISKEVAAAQSYSSDTLQAAHKSHQNIEYVIPSEGCTRSIDNIVILKSAPHWDNALALMDFMLSPEVDRDRAERLFSGPVLTQTRKSLPQELKDNPGLFPSAEILKRMERIQDLGRNNSLYEKIWTEIKSQ
jgi:spermidine/putrescine transport system substrate-binding protein